MSRKKEKKRTFLFFNSLRLAERKKLTTRQISVYGWLKDSITRSGLGTGGR